MGSEPRIRRLAIPRHVLCACVVVLASFIGGSVAAASARPPRLTSVDAPGLRLDRATHTVRRELTVRLGLRLGRDWSGSVLRAHGRTLIDAAVVFPSRAKAQAALVRARRWRPRARPLSGIPHALIQVTRSRARVVVVVRSAVVIVDYRGPRPAAPAIGWARVLVERLVATANRTPWQRTLATVPASDHVSRATAIRAFNLAYTPIPGTGHPRGGPGVVPDGTVAAAWIGRYLDTLTPSQRAAASAALGLRTPSATHERILTARASGVELTSDPRLSALTDKYVETYSRLVGEPLRAFVRIGWVRTLREGSGPGASGDSEPLDVNGARAHSDNESTCLVRISRAAHRGFSEADLDNTVAHEIFHCFQFQMAPRNWDRDGNDWIMEGSAEWAADTVAPVSLNETSSDPGRYYAFPDASYDTGDPKSPAGFFNQTYSAAYFWGRLSEVNGPPWSRIRAALNASDNASAFDAAGATSTSFAGQWASSYARLPSAGAAWQTSSPLPVSASQIPTPRDQVTGDATLKSTPYGSHLFQLNATGDHQVARITLDVGHGRITDRHQDIAMQPGGEETLCLGRVCNCPPGQELNDLQVRDTSGPVTVAIGGDPEAAQATIQFDSMKNLCTSRDPAFCPTSKPLRYPGSGQALLAWYESALTEDQRIRDTLIPYTHEQDSIGAQLDALGGYTPGTPQETQEHMLRNALWRVQVKEWPLWCRHQELGVQDGQVTASAARRHLITAKNRPAILRIMRRYADLVLYMNRDLTDHPGGMPAHNLLADGPPFPNTG